jgi:hypothetical protein
MRHFTPSNPGSVMPAQEKELAINSPSKPSCFEVFSCLANCGKAR